MNRGVNSFLRGRSDEHLSRKAFHVLTGTGVVFLYASIFTRAQATVWMSLAAVALISLDLLRLNSKRFNRRVLALYGPLMRKSEYRGPSGQLYYVLGLTFSIVFLPRTLAIQAMLTLAWMDPVASLFGLRIGKRSWNNVFSAILPESQRLPIDLGAKTLEGSFAGFLAAFLAGVIAWTGPWAAIRMGSGLWWPGPGLVLLFSALGGLVAVVAEAWPSQWDDNINIPFWTGLVLWAVAVVFALPLQS